MTTRTTTPARKTAKRTRPAAKATPKAVLQPVAEDAPMAATMPSVPPEKQKLVRDSFTMPKREYDQIGALKTRLIKLSHAIKKGEVLRAGIAALTAMSDVELLAAVEQVQRLKTGRPGNAKAFEKRSTKKRS